MRPLLPLAAPHAIHSAAELEEIVAQSPLPVLVDVFGPRDGAVDAEVEKLARAKAGGAVVAKVSSDEMPEVAARLGVTDYPTFILFTRGRETRRFAGAIPASALIHEMQAEQFERAPVAK